MLLCCEKRSEYMFNQRAESTTFKVTLWIRSDLSEVHVVAVTARGIHVSITDYVQSSSTNLVAKLNIDI